MLVIISGVTSSQPSSAIHVVMKASALIDALAQHPESTANEIATLIDEPRSSVYRLLATLTECGLVEPSAQRGCYRLGLKLFTCGEVVAARFRDLQGAALPVMDRVRSETHQTVFLSIRRGYDAFCVERLDGTWVRVMLLARGGTLPLHAGSGPRVLLAHEPQTFWREYAEHRVATVDDGLPFDVVHLQTQLEAILADGVAVSDEDVLPGITSIGAPIFDYTGAVRAALSLSGLRESVFGDDGQHVVGVVTRAAAEISQTLGFQPDGR